MDYSEVDKTKSNILEINTEYILGRKKMHYFYFPLLLG